MLAGVENMQYMPHHIPNYAADPDYTRVTIEDLHPNFRTPKTIVYGGQTDLIKVCILYY